MKAHAFSDYIALVNALKECIDEAHKKLEEGTLMAIAHVLLERGYLNE